MAPHFSGAEIPLLFFSLDEKWRRLQVKSRGADGSRRPTFKEVNVNSEDCRRNASARASRKNGQIRTYGMARCRAWRLHKKTAQRRVRKNWGCPLEWDTQL